MNDKAIVISMPADLKYLNLLGGVIRSLLARIEGLEEPDVLIYHLDLALQEVATNIVRHAYEEIENGRFEVRFQIDEQNLLEIVFTDQGKRFAIEEVAEPNLDESQIHGYGLFLVRHIMDEVNYQSSDKENQWHLTKQLLSGVENGD